MKNSVKSRISLIQLSLTVFYVIVMITSNLISAQLISLPFKAPFDSMTSAVIIFPIVCILSDLFQELFGYKWSRITCYFAFGMNIFVNLITTLVAALPITGSGSEAFKTLFGITTGMGWCVLAASLTAFFFGDLLNDKIFAKLKTKHPDSYKGFGFRAVLSTLGGQILDSSIYLPFALVIFPKLFLGFSYVTVPTVIAMIVMQVIIKVAYEWVTLPLTKFVIKKVDALQKVDN